MTTAKSFIRSSLRSLGFEVRRRRNVVKGSSPLLPIFENPIEALYETLGGREAAFWCPLDHCVGLNGLSLRKNGWHPYLATMTDYLNGIHTVYEGSVLERYYRMWNPASAAEAILGFNEAPAVLHSLPAHCISLSPWTSLDPRDVDAHVRKWYAADNAQHGCAHLVLEQDGIKTHGPVSAALGELEFRRCTTVLASLQCAPWESSMCRPCSHAWRL